MKGGKPEGWIVQIKAGGQVLDTKASNPELEDEANDPQKMAKLKPGR